MFDNRKELRPTSLQIRRQKYATLKLTWQLDISLISKVLRTVRPKKTRSRAKSSWEILHYSDVKFKPRLRVKLKCDWQGNVKFQQISGTVCGEIVLSLVTDASRLSPVWTCTLLQLYPVGTSELQNIEFCVKIKPRSEFLLVAWWLSLACHQLWHFIWIHWQASLQVCWWKCHGI